MTQASTVDGGGEAPRGGVHTEPSEWRGVVERLGPEGKAEWNAYVDAHPEGGCYHRYAWRTVAERSYGLRTPFLVARERPGGAIQGALPLFVVERPFGRYVTSALFGGYGAILADSEGARRALADEACKVTRDLGAQHLKLKTFHEPALPTGFVRLDMGAVATLSLEGGADEVWKRFRNKERNAIRKAQKSGLELHVGLRELPGFYDVLAGNYHRKGTPIYGYTMVETLAAELGEHAEAVTLRKDGATISGALVLYDKTTVLVPFASSRPDAFHLNPNNLIYWEIMRRAAARGMKQLDFGRSPVGSGSMAFKLHWGAETTPQPYDIYTARGEPPSLDVEAPVVQTLINIWKRLPRPVADLFGPWVHGHFLV